MHTENVKFYLHSPKSDNPTAIYAKIHLKGNEVKISIGIKIQPELWDRSTQRPSTDKNLLNQWKKHDPSIKVVLGNIESRINRVRDVITTYVNLMEHAGDQFSGDEVRQHVQESLGLIEKQVNSQSIIEYTERFIEDIESGKRLTASKGRYTVGTIKNYKGFLSQLKEFQKGYKKIIRFDDVSLDMYDAYVEFFQNKGYSPNSIGRHIKSLKVIMRSAEEEGLHSNRVYNDKRFRMLTAPVDSIYLTEEEIDKMRGLDLSNKPKFEQTLNIFILGTQTALRWSDYRRIRPHHIHQDGDDLKLVMHMKKTGQKVTIPLNSIAREILQKYEQSIPHIPEQVFNRYIKQIGNWAGIDQPIEVTKYRGAEKVKVVIPKYELISTHTARRSAATNLVKAGVSLEYVRRITGHSTIKNLLKYIRLTEDEVYDHLKESAFFKR